LYLDIDPNTARNAPHCPSPSVVSLLAGDMWKLRSQSQIANILPHLSHRLCPAAADVVTLPCC